MGVFGFLKKRRTEDLPMPPPPSPPELPPLLRGDMEEIRAPETAEEHEEQLPELPPALPAPKFAEAPGAWQPAMEKEEDRTIQHEEKEIIRPSMKPAFVAVEDYKRIINDTNMIRSKLMDAENFVKRLSDLKNEEERSFEKWRTQLEDVEKKMNYVDQLIAKAG